jgi:hypothetical protein
MAEATDIFGNTVQQGFRITRLPEANKQVLIGAGGIFPAGLGTVPNEPGMHTLVVQIRDYTGTHIVKSAYWKIGVVDGFEDFQGDVTADRTLVRTKATDQVHLREECHVNDRARHVHSAAGPAAVSVVRDTERQDRRDAPQPPDHRDEFPADRRGNQRLGDWSFRQAPVNWPTGFGYIEGVTESDDTKYGGTDPNHNCGTLRYVRVEFAGSALSPNNEVNGITWGACGKATITDHVEAKYGFDDNLDWFGGNSDAKYLVSAYPRDDFIDGQIGWTGRLQHVVAMANKEYQGNRGIEMDNNEQDFGAQPLSKPQMYNFTFVGAGEAFTQGVDEGTGVAALWLRRGTGGAYNNMILYNWVSGGFEVRDDATLARIDSKDLTANGILMWDNGKLSGKANTLEGQSTSTAAPFLNGQRGGETWKWRSELRGLEGSDRFPAALGSPIFRASYPTRTTVSSTSGRRGLALVIRIGPRNGPVSTRRTISPDQRLLSLPPEFRPRVSGIARGSEVTSRYEMTNYFDAVAVFCSQRVTTAKLYRTRTEQSFRDLPDQTDLLPETEDVDARLVRDRLSRPHTASSNCCAENDRGAHQKFEQAELGRGQAQFP